MKLPFEIIDLSVPLEHMALSEPLPARIRYITHAEEGLRQMEQFFGIEKEDLGWSDGLGWAVEEIQANTHTGTHVDAPYHYAPRSEGKAAKTIDEIPLEWCFAPGVRLDLRGIPAGESIGCHDLQSALDRIEYELEGGEIVLIQTGADARLGVLVQREMEFGPVGVGEWGRPVERVTASCREGFSLWC